MISIIRASRILMREVATIINSNFALYQNIISNSKDLQNHQIDEAWIAQNYPIREFYLARTNGNYIGMVSYQHLPPVAYVGYLFIKAGYYRQGYGKTLMQFIKLRAKLDKLDRICLFTNPKAVWAMDAYRSMAFDIITTEKADIMTFEGGILRDFYEEGSVLFQKYI